MPKFTTNGNSSVYEMRGRDVVLYAGGTFDSASVAAQTYDDGWYTVGSLSVAGTVAFVDPGKNNWRINVSGGGGSMDLTAVLRGEGTFAKLGWTAAPGVGTFSFTGYAPVDVPDYPSWTPAPGEYGLSHTGYAPSPVIDVVITVDAGTLTAAGKDVVA